MNSIVVGGYNDYTGNSYGGYSFSHITQPIVAVGSYAGKVYTGQANPVADAGALYNRASIAVSTYTASYSADTTAYGGLTAFSARSAGIGRTAGGVASVASGPGLARAGLYSRSLGMGFKPHNYTIYYRGGAHGHIQGGGYKVEAHHLPADSISPITRYSGPAIQMTKRDHGFTSSYANSLASRNYRARVEQLIGEGNMRGAMATEIVDARRAAVRGGGAASKYNGAIREMLDYSYGKGWLDK